MQMTLTAKGRGYPPINRAPPCTLSVVALRYTSRREIAPRVNPPCLLTRFTLPHRVSQTRNMQICSRFCDYARFREP